MLCARPPTGHGQVAQKHEAILTMILQGQVQQLYSDSLKRKAGSLRKNLEQYPCNLLRPWMRRWAPSGAKVDPDSELAAPDDSIVNCTIGFLYLTGEPALKCLS